ncbi:ABC transporter permease subunit, partial [Aeromonas salmonicida]|uniref:ABC transporter permease subunit n=2 Tax=Aeromonas salmonicida TaxID=645 RepID=UPI0031D84533
LRGMVVLRSLGFQLVPFKLHRFRKQRHGAGNFRIFIEIIMPLSKPIIAVVALFSFTGPLGDFILASTILRTPDQFTLPIGLYNLVAQKMGASYTTYAAGAVLIAVPVAILYLSLQKYFVSGLTAGGTKG